MPKNKKPVIATEDDIQALSETLREEIQKAQAASQSAMQMLEQRLGEQIKAAGRDQLSSTEKLRSEITEARTDSRSYTEECVKNLSDNLLDIVSKLGDQVSQSNHSLSTQIQDVDTSMRQLMSEELAAICDRFDQELGTLKSEMMTSMEKWAKEAAESLVQQRHEIDTAIGALKKQVDADRREALIKFAHASVHEQAVANQKLSDEKAEERINLQHAEIYVKIGLVQETLDAAREKAASDNSKTASDATSGLAKLTQHCQERLEKLDGETSRLFDSMSVVESFTTKRVEWVIQKASQKLRADWGNSGEALHTGWFSPKFDAGGCFGLQLELQLFRITEDQLAGKQEIGNLAAFLWACKGTSLVYKLYIGSKSMICEKTFNGRVPYGTPRLAWLHEQINKEDDTLRVGVEILESVREVEHPIKPLPFPPEALADDIVSADAAYAAREAAKHSAEGSLFFKRHITNRLMEQVHREVELMQSRMVRKVEWRVQHASLLRTCFVRDVAICSPKFNCSGMEGLQFVFYPSGYRTATEGYCSLFIYGPIGATLRCQLSIGKQSRAVNHSFDESGAVGRTNFCSFEGIIDEGNVVFVRLEIEDAQQDMRAATVHPGPEVAPGDRRTIGQIEGNDIPPIESVVKLTRNPGSRRPPPSSNCSVLEDQLVLPSLWTPKRLGDGPSVPEGFKNFDELEDMQPFRPGTAGLSKDPGTRPATTARPVSAVRPGSAAGLRRNASLPGRPRSSMKRCPLAV